MCPRNDNLDEVIFGLGLRTMILPLETAAFKAVKTPGSGERRRKRSMWFGKVGHLSVITRSGTFGGSFRVFGVPGTFDSTCGQ